MSRGGSQALELPCEDDHSQDDSPRGLECMASLDSQWEDNLGTW